MPGARADGTARSYPGRGHRYDLAVVGGGPSGCEAAWAAAKGGLDTLLVTTSMDTIYNLVGDGWRLDPPADTLMATLHERGADERGCVSTWGFHRGAKEELERTPGLHVLQSNVAALLVENGQTVGVATWEGVDRLARRVALAAGSFLGARLHVGEVTEAAGKLSEMAYDDLFEDLQRHGFAFRALELRADAGGGSLPYRVRCHAFDAHEMDGFRLPRLDHLWAAGLCARGELSFEAAAADGRGLANAVLAAAGREAGA